MYPFLEEIQAVTNNSHKTSYFSIVDLEMDVSAYGELNCMTVINFKELCQLFPSRKIETIATTVFKS